MSATQRGRVRNTFDDYPTSAWPVRRLLERCDLPGGYWIEPTCGFGMIVRTVMKIRSDVEWYANDVQERNRERIKKTTGLPEDRILTQDVRTLDVAWLKNFQVFMTNPPFDIAQNVLEKGMEAGIVTVLLLRSAYLSSEERNGWLRNHVPDNFILPNRPKFLVNADEYEMKPDKKTGVLKKKKKGGDATDYSWLVWYPGERSEGRTVILDSTPLDERKADHEEMRRLAV